MKNTMYEIIPAILEKEWEKIEEKIEQALGFAKTIHIDLLDGKFAPNTTFMDPKPFAKYTGQFFFELHIMAEEPLQYLRPFAEVGFKRFIAQIEKMSDVSEFVAQGQILGEVGIAIDGPTGLSSLKTPLDDLDNILIMTINAGFSGQAFNAEYAQKIAQIREKSLIPIEVDGGINESTIKKAYELGANRLAASSAIYKEGDPLVNFQLLKARLESK